MKREHKKPFSKKNSLKGFFILYVPNKPKIRRIKK